MSLRIENIWANLNTTQDAIPFNEVAERYQNIYNTFQNGLEIMETIENDSIPLIRNDLNHPLNRGFRQLVAKSLVAPAIEKKDVPLLDHLFSYDPEGCRRGLAVIAPRKFWSHWKNSMITLQKLAQLWVDYSPTLTSHIPEDLPVPNPKRFLYRYDSCATTHNRPPEDYRMLEWLLTKNPHWFDSFKRISIWDKLSPDLIPSNYSQLHGAILPYPEPKFCSHEDIEEYRFGIRQLTYFQRHQKRSDILFPSDILSDSDPDSGDELDV